MNSDSVGGRRGIAAPLLLAAGLLPAMAGAQQDWQEARQLARACQACHGLDGLSRQANAPNIAGQPVQYLERQLRAFRAGERHDPQMSIAVAHLSDVEIGLLAAYYGAIRIEVVEIPGS